MLWRRVNRGLSAGRVQSPSVRLIVERERERIAFVQAGYWDIELLTATSPAFTATLVALDDAKVATGKDFGSDGQVQERTSWCVDEARARGLADESADVGVHRRSVEEKPVSQRPEGPVHDVDAAAGGRPQAAAQRVAGHACGAGSVRAWLHHLHANRQRHAQRRGAVGRARRGEARRTATSSCRRRPAQFSSKTKNAQEAHEAIRPSTPLRSPDSLAAELNGQELSMYRMIWQRTLASQMADATGVTVTVRLAATAVDRRVTMRWTMPCSRPAARPSASPATARCTSSRSTTARPATTNARRCCHRSPSAQVVRVESLDTERPHHLAAGALHRGVAREASRRARHRAAVDVGVDHPDGAGPRLRVEEGSGVGADVDRVRRRRPDGEALRRAWSTTRSPRASRRTSTRSPATSGRSRTGCSTSTSATRPTSFPV